MPVEITNTADLAARRGERENKVMLIHLWLGDRELFMFSQKGRYVVLDSYKDYSTIFSGDYGECEEFMNQQFIEYQEERIG